MNIEEEIGNICSALREHHARLKRLEGVEGADRRLVAPPRSGGQPGAGEQRSVDGCAVAPGEAEAAAAYCEDTAARFMEIARANGKQGMQNLAAFNAGIAAGWESAAVVLPLLLTRQPQPDSGASEIPAPLPDVATSTEASTATPTSDERSGRRNDKIH